MFSVIFIDQISRRATTTKSQTRWGRPVNLGTQRLKQKDQLFRSFWATESVWVQQKLVRACLKIKGKEVWQCCIVPSDTGPAWHICKALDYIAGTKHKQFIIKNQTKDTANQNQECTVKTEQLSKIFKSFCLKGNKLIRKGCKGPDCFKDTVKNSSRWHLQRNSGHCRNLQQTQR